MQVPLQLSFKDVEKDPLVEDQIRGRSEGLERFCDHINSCRVVVEKPQQHQSSGNPFRVRVDLTIAGGHEVVAKQEAGKGDMHDPLQVVVKKVFDSAEKQLKKLTDKQHGHVKLHPQQQSMATVSKKFEDEGYGFLRTIDTGDEIYFHKNSVLNGDFAKVKVGTGVRFVFEQGEKGPQASTVEIMETKGNSI
jgi:cold shock CspA family protein